MTFEQYLEEQCSKEVHGDNPDHFFVWFEQLDYEELLTYAQQWHEQESNQ